MIVAQAAHIEGGARTLVMAEDQGNGPKMCFRLKERYEANKSKEIQAPMGRIARPKRVGPITGTPASVGAIEKEMQRL